MGRLTDTMKLLGSKAVESVKAGSNVIGKELDKAVAEQKRKKAIYKDEYQKALEVEREQVRRDKDELVRKKAREDAKRKVRGVQK